MSLWALTQDGPMQENIGGVQSEGVSVTERLTHKVRSASVNPSPKVFYSQDQIIGGGHSFAVTERIPRLP